MTPKRGRRAIVEIRTSHLGVVRDCLATATLPIRKEEETGENSVRLFFSGLTEAQFMQLLNTIPREAYAKGGMGIEVALPLLPKDAQQLFQKKS